MKGIDKLDEDEKILLLKALMIDLRGSWRSPQTRIDAIVQLCENIKTLPAQFLDAVMANAIEFDGYLIDGRIFRDGQLHLDEDTVDKLGLPEGMKYGVSGNLVKSLGAKHKKTPYKYYGTYSELEQWCKLPDKFRPRSDDFKKICDYLLEYPEHIFDDYYDET